MVPFVYHQKVSIKSREKHEMRQNDSIFAILTGFS